MTTYNTYQEAKMANPERNVFCTIKNSNSAAFGLFDELNKFTDGIKQCDPADYCMSLAEFFAAGHKFADGDDYMNSQFEVMTVGVHVSAGVVNTPSNFDEDMFVLKARALEENEESVEWKNGDILDYKDEDDEWFSGGRYVCYDQKKGCHVIECHDIRLYHAFGDQIRKPETPDQKREREELEAAYELYVDWHETIGHESVRHISTFKEDDNYALFRFLIAKQKNLI